LRGPSALNLLQTDTIYRQVEQMSNHHLIGVAFAFPSDQAITCLSALAGTTFYNFRTARTVDFYSVRVVETVVTFDRCRILAR